MPLYLVVPPHRRTRAVHEKARVRAGYPLHWVRSYIEDVDDETLYGETLTVRALDEIVLKLAAKAGTGKEGWRIPDDPIALAGRLGVRPREVRRGLTRLVELGRLELVDAPVIHSSEGQIRLALDDAPEPHPSHNGAGPEPHPNHTPTTPGPHPSHDVAGVSAQIQASLASSASSALTQSRSRAEAEKKALPSNGTVASYAAAADAEDRPIVNRLIGIACKGSTASASVLRYECVGLPDAAIARTIESVLGRNETPRNRAGYAVNTLRALRAEYGVPDTRPRIEREPTLR